MKYFSSLLILVLAGSALSSCAVYQPATPSTPLLRSQGEAEVTAAVLPPGKLEVSAAWVPATSILLTVEGSVLQTGGNDSGSSANSEDQNQHRQAGVGFGTYRLLRADKSVYLGIVGGMGISWASIYSGEFDSNTLAFSRNQQLTLYEATYQRSYCQLYVAKTVRLLSFGASLRSTFVHYRTLTRNEVPISAAASFYLEPTLFLRFGRGKWQGQATVGLSEPNAIDHQSPDYAKVSPISAIVSGGVVFRPDLRKHREAATAW
ncbi:MAG: hypothetical protein M3Y54_13725 [Bacteroidota bacterium]|nr:hypothetical protein [Bacteroidota bacterium]